MHARAALAVLLLPAACARTGFSPAADGAASDAARGDLGGRGELLAADAPARDGGKKRKGEQCAEVAECNAGLACVDNVCCSSSCGGPCESCNLSTSVGDCAKVPADKDPRQRCTGSHPKCAGTCDGAGGCTFAAVAGRPCGDQICAGGTITSLVCIANGACVGKVESCGGYVCDANSVKCRMSCDSDKDCVPPAACAGAKCTSSLPLGAACGTNNDACASKLCTDGVCCAVASCGACRSCSSSSAGQCADLPAGPAPASHCPGDAACGAGECDGNGVCSYKPAGAGCASSCSAGQVIVSKCEPTHKCVASVSTSCGAYQCDAAAGKCHSGCIGLGECVKGSLCDRSEAHLAGHGKCVSPAEIVLVDKGGTHPTLAAGVAATAPGKGYVRVSPGTYDESVTVTAPWPVRIVGSPVSGASGGTAIRGASQPAVTVAAGASVVLQGLSLAQLGPGMAPAVGCDGAGDKKTALTVVECVLGKSGGEGLKATACEVALHRNTITGNARGGVVLEAGRQGDKLTLVDNVIVDNGSPTSLAGGVSIGSGLAVLSFVNNTVVKNLADPAAVGAASGVRCSVSTMQLTVQNSIVYGNVGAPPHAGCGFSYSDIEGGAAGAGNIAVDPLLDVAWKPTSPKCFDAGDTAAAKAATAIDRGGGKRVLGNAVDLGAYEVK